MIRNFILAPLLFFLSINLLIGQQYTERSKLADGEIYKFKVAAEGIYQIDYDLISSLEDINLNAIRADQIQILTNDFGTIPERNQSNRIDDLTEIPTFQIGLTDGTFDAGDRIVFFMGSPDNIQLVDNRISVNRNPYDFHNYFFLKISDNPGKKFQPRSFSVQADTVFEEYLQFHHHEKELINLQDYVVGQHGSGKRWFGEPFSIERKRQYTDEFIQQLTPFEESSLVHLDFGFAARAGSGANVRVKLNDKAQTFNINKTFISNGESPVAVPVSGHLQTNGNSLTELSVEFLPRNSNDEAWLDYLTLNYITKTVELKNGSIIQHPESIGKNSRYSIQGLAGNIQVLNVTKAKNIYAVQTSQENGKILFQDTASSELQRYAILDLNDNFPKPEQAGAVDHQNLHGIEVAQCLVIYHPKFEKAVDRWMAHRSSFQNMKIEKADIFSIYNEFGGGAQDPAAIRDFAKMLYDKDSSFKYLLLFGDGSFDYRYINKNNPFSNYIPVYESDNSLSPISSYPTDDFYGLLSPSEGGSIEGALEISIGRFPVNSEAEANALVNKVIRYDTEPKTLGDWQLRSVFLADDEDGNRHLKDGNEIAERVRQNPFFNVEKIYFDAFPQVSQAGGIRIPGATESLNESIFKGSLIITYLGHGGPFGMAQERILDINQIQSWNNRHKLPLFVTATCSFAPYDDPSIFSAGEIMVTKENGGSIALFTTVRPVYSTSNKRLTKAVHDKIIENLNNTELAIGDILRLAKNSNSQDTLTPNARKFTLLGDPTLRLAIPEYRIITESINGNNAQIESDTAGPLRVTRVSGYIADELGDIVTSFNGELTPTLFDKVEIRKTLGQDERSYVYEYAIQDNVLWKGKVPVVNGQFEFNFVLPKSLDPEYGQGRISYYARENNGLKDAAGSYNDIIIGGYPDDSLSLDEPPTVELFMESDLFQNGDKVGPNPFLFARVSDDIGINLSTNEIGKEITAFIDGNTSQPIILNSFFEPSSDDYRKGSIRYPLQNLEEGWHELKLRVWDVSGNYAEEIIHFEVVLGEDSEIIEWSAYPNPFEESTCLRLKTSLAEGNYDAELQIMNASGQMMQKQTIRLALEGSEISCIEWRPGSIGNDHLYPGLYFARLKIVGLSNNTHIYTPVHKLIYIN